MQVFIFFPRHTNSAQVLVLSAFILKFLTTYISKAGGGWYLGMLLKLYDINLHGKHNFGEVGGTGFLVWDAKNDLKKCRAVLTVQSSYA